MRTITRRELLWQGGIAVGGLVAAPLIRLAPADAAIAGGTLTKLTNAHWGLFNAEVVGGRLMRTLPFAKDPHPNPMVTVMPDLLYTSNRVKYPMIREGFYRNRSRSDTAGRGVEPFVRVSWDEALGIVADELRRVKMQYGNRAIFGGSYGWQSPGRLHGASQAMQRLLVLLGGYVYYVNTYSAPTLPVISPHVVGDASPKASAWPSLIKNSQLVVMFGYDPFVNAEVLSGDGGHLVMDFVRQLRDAKIPVVSVNPLETDTDQFLKPQHIAIRPNTDTALMLGLAHVLYTENLHDRAFLDKYTVGFDKFADYLSGKADGQPKSPEWAAPITDVPVETIRALARRMAKSRTVLMGGYPLQRAVHGEQPVWMMITLSAMLGQLGLPGGGVQIDFPSRVGAPLGTAPAVPGLTTGTNPVKDFVPVNMWTDMLLNPGKTIDYDGQKVTYPDIKLVYWAGGNPFHHAQNVNRVVQAWQRPEVTIVHEYAWTATAKHADIVLPATTTLERNDIVGTSRFIAAMPQIVPPLFEARDDFDICAALAGRLGVGAQYTEGKEDEMAWLRQFYATAQQQAKARGLAMPEFDAFWQQGYLEFSVTDAANQLVGYAEFRADPVNHPLGTPSGKIEIYSEAIAGFKYDDCPPHPTWLAPDEWLGSEKTARYPLHLLSPHPKDRLHSQLDQTRLRERYEVAEREPIWINPSDAAARGIANGDVVRVFNNRGQTLAGAVVTARTRRGVVAMHEGGWYDPLTPGQLGTLDRHGSINAVSTDAPNSKLSDGNPSHSALVQIEKYVGMPPTITAFAPPKTAVAWPLNYRARRWGDVAHPRR
ncbi:MAG TPA: molybdopterin-dependent oxidoreductase [bacterium]|nr:molybdopterin-dependent oxidoreductase [bacterium]